VRNTARAGRSARDPAWETERHHGGGSRGAGLGTHVYETISRRRRNAGRTVL
jgi:hypothetical protein